MSGILLYGVPQRITELKAVDDGAWEVSGFPSTFGTKDLGNDVIHRGAFAHSLAAGQPVRFLYAHDPSQVLGTTLAGFLASSVLLHVHAQALGLTFGPIDTIFTGGAALALIGALYALRRLGFSDPAPVREEAPEPVQAEPLAKAAPTE